LISLVIANEKVKAKYPDKSSKPVKLVEEGVYYMGKTGRITSRMANVIGTFPNQLHLWVGGVEGHYDIYYAAVVELLGYCERIGVDLTLEDATKYQEEFINSLPFDYIIRNDDLSLAVESQKSRLSKESLPKIRGMSIDDLAQPGKTLQTATGIGVASKNNLAAQAIVTKTMGMYLNRMELRQFMFTDTEQYMAFLKLSTAFVKIKMGNIVEHGMYRNDGFYMNRTGTPVVMKNIAYLGGGGGVNVIFHDSGYAILVPSSGEGFFTVKCVSFPVFIQTLRDYELNNKGAARLDWETL
jgi:hypothetical protein